jgi:hypothetical protein
LFVVERAVWCLEEEPPPIYPRSDLRLLFFGDDRDGIPLEVVAVETSERRLIIIHAMLLREGHRSGYEGAQRWLRKSDTQ